MPVQNNVKTQFAVMFSQMLPYFSLPEFSRENWKPHLQFYHFISHLGLLAWNITLVKPSLAAAEKTLLQISKAAYADDTVIILLLLTAVRWKWNHCRNEKDFFAMTEVSFDPETGDFGVETYYENEADDEGMSFSEFRNALKSGDARRNITALMKKHTCFDADLENFLQYKNRFGLPIYSMKKDFAELAKLLFKVFMLFLDIKTKKGIDAVEDLAILITKMLFTGIEPNCRYEDAINLFPEKYRLNLFQFDEKALEPFAVELKVAIGQELLYGHDDFLQDWNKIIEPTLRYIPEQYRDMAENALRKELKLCF